MLDLFGPVLLLESHLGSFSSHDRKTLNSKLPTIVNSAYDSSFLPWFSTVLDAVKAELAYAYPRLGDCNGRYDVVQE